MDESFPSAPLIELVATLRWNTGGGNDELEDVQFLKRLGREMARVGFTQSERIIPEGYEIAPNQPLYRYTTPDDLQDAVIYQAGTGAFAINAIPPYKTWQDFQPAIAQGLEAFFAALGDRTDFAVAEYLALNYVDAFDASYWGDDQVGFLRDKLGIQLTVPSAYESRLASGQVNSLFVNFSGMDAEGLETRVKAGVATIGNEPVVILDTTVIRAENLKFASADILDVLNRLHDVIHNSFMEISEPFADVMRRPVDA